MYVLNSEDLFDKLFKFFIKMVMQIVIRTNGLVYIQAFSTLQRLPIKCDVIVVFVLSFIYN